MVSFLYDDLDSLVCEIMSWFIKPTILEKINNGSSLCKLDLTNKENIPLCNKIGIGCDASKIINNKIYSDTEHEGKSTNTRRNMLPFFPLEYSFMQAVCDL